jgi:DNA-binding MarR family transcriptional regulator
MRTIDSDPIATVPSDATSGADAAISTTEGSAAERELVDRIMAEFHVFTRELRCVGTERLVKAGVSMTNLHVMGLLSHHGEMPMSKLADLLDVSLSNATGLIDRMEERGFVERIRVPDDRRVVLVRLTHRGASTLEEAEIVRRDLIDRILRRLDAVQLGRLAQSLSDIHEAVAGLQASIGPGLFAAAHAHWHADNGHHPLNNDHA